jgi:hypothetical protein
VSGSRCSRAVTLPPLRLDDIAPPDIAPPATAAARAAAEVAAVHYSPALLNYCRRSYLWAADYGRQRGIAFGAELLYVATMLHDIGLVPVFDSATVPFEEAGGEVAWVFAAGAGWPVGRSAAPRRSSSGTCGPRWTRPWTPRVTC